MAFVKNKERKSLSLPGMIDVIFLLLIFSLVTLSTSESGVETKKRGEHTDKFDLPRINQAETFEADKVLHTLLFQIEHIDPKDILSAKRLLVLWPSVQNSTTIELAIVKALSDWNVAQQNGTKPGFAAIVPPDYLTLSNGDFEKTDVCRLIKKSIQEYSQENFFEPSLSNRIEIRAVKDTKFRLVNYIMTECGKYDKLIPRCVFRTLTEEK